MKIRDMMLVALAALFAGKYMQLAALGINSLEILTAGNLVVLVAMAVILIFDYLLLDGKYRLSSMGVIGAGAAFLVAYLVYPTVILYLISQLLLATGFLMLLLPLHHYETKKYPAFGSAFLVIYVLTESVSMWRGDYSIPVLAIYLSLSLVMFIPGILKIREREGEEKE